MYQVRGIDHGEYLLVMFFRTKRVVSSSWSCGSGDVPDYAFMLGLRHKLDHSQLQLRTQPLDIGLGILGLDVPTLLSLHRIWQVDSLCQQRGLFKPCRFPA